MEIGFAHVLILDSVSMENGGYGSVVTSHMQHDVLLGNDSKQPPDE